jgi:hypothetical protein
MAESSQPGSPTRAASANLGMHVPNSRVGKAPRTVKSTISSGSLPVESVLVEGFVQSMLKGGSLDIYCSNTTEVANSITPNEHCTRDLTKTKARTELRFGLNRCKSKASKFESTGGNPAGE